MRLESELSDRPRDNPNLEEQQLLLAARNSRNLEVEPALVHCARCLRAVDSHHTPTRGQTSKTSVRPSVIPGDTHTERYCTL